MTDARTLSDRPLTEDGLVDRLNREVIPVLRQLLNQFTARAEVYEGRITVNETLGTRVSDEPIELISGVTLKSAVTNAQDVTVHIDGSVTTYALTPGAVLFFAIDDLSHARLTAVAPGLVVGYDAA